MVFQIVIAGESQSEKFAEVCLIADYLSQNLPKFCYRRIEKPVLEWKVWLYKINQKNNWHHVGNLLVWKEFLTDGSKSLYIGGASEFFDYCHSYYKFDTYLAADRFEDLIINYSQLQFKHKRETQLKSLDIDSIITKISEKKNFTVCISGAAHPLTMHLISGLLDMTFGNKRFSKIYIYDKQDTTSFLKFVERECYYIGSKNMKVVKSVKKIGIALTSSDLLIILDHYSFTADISVGNWLCRNKKIMENLAFMINASAPPNICIILPNLGPACYNATVLRNSVTNMKKSNIVVATADLGLNIMSIAANIAEVPMRNMFCPPVWGFVGINHLVDIRTTVHKYNSFEPLARYAKVPKTTLCIGTLIPEMRTLEYLMHFDESLWLKVAEKNMNGRREFNKAIAVLDAIQLWFLEQDNNKIISLGISCDGSFGLLFNGVFSQPACIVDGEWKPASKFLMPRDPQMNFLYLEKIAELIMGFGKHDLPPNFSAE